MQSFRPVSEENFPKEAASISVDWINGVLTRCGVLDDRTVNNVDVEEINSRFGIMGSYARIHLAGTDLPASAPRTLFAKYSTEHDASLVLSRREVLFYKTIALDAPLRLPLCYFAGANAEDTQVLILMEDVTDGTQGDTLNGCTDGEAVKVVESLSRLHSQNWGITLTADTQWLQRVNEQLAPWFESILSSTWMPFVDAQGGLPVWAERIADVARAKLAKLFQMIVRPPITVVHGDCQPDNLKFNVGDSDVLFLDWQLTMVSRPSHDIVWYFTHGVPTVQRRRIQTQLIDVYFSSLAPGAAAEFTPEMLEKDALFWSPAILLNSALAADAAATQDGTRSTEPASRPEMSETLKRILAFIEDLDPERVIAALETL